jgi:aurora kinase
METNQNNFLPPCVAVSEGLEPEIKISDFEQLANLGTGGYGKVNLYRHKITGAEYAIKLIDKTKFENKLQKDLFSREVEMMYKIKHPNIVRLYTHFEDESNCYIALEYIKKGNLYSYTQSMPNKVLDAASTANFVVDLVSSLYYLHNMTPPIIHRDIKPENLLLGNNGHLKLTDFGGSNYLEGKVRYTTAGTQLYHSPEMLLKKGYDTRVDIWAIGVLIFELLVGRPPFVSDGQHSIEDNIVHGRVNWPNSMNLLAKNLITKLLKLDPDQRPTLEEILQHQFILDYVQDPKSRLILPSEVEIKPFVISKQLPGEEFVKSEEIGINNNSKNNERYSNNEEYKSLYENVKIAYEKLKKEKEELSDKKKENDIKIKQLRKYMEDSKKVFEKEIDDKLNDYLEAKMALALNEEEIKSLKQRINLLEEKNKKLENDLLNSENNNKIKIKKYKDDIKLLQEKINQIFQGKITDKSQIDSRLLEFADDGMLALYKKENDNLRQQNSKLLKDLEELNEKILRDKEESNVKEIQRNDILNQLLRENKAELEKKNNIINKLYNVLADVSHFMDKIKVKNFMFTFDGNNFNNLENIRKLIYNIQPAGKSNTRSSSNSKDDVYSNKRKTNALSTSGSVIYFN